MLRVLMRWLRWGREVRPLPLLRVQLVVAAVPATVGAAIATVAAIERVVEAIIVGVAIGLVLPPFSAAPASTYGVPADTPAPGTAPAVVPRRTLVAVTRGTFVA